MAELAARVRAAYFRNRNYVQCQARSDYGKGYTYPWDHKSSHGKTIWEKIAEGLVRQNVTDPERFVHAQFAYSSRPEGLLPPYLLSEDSQENYRKYCLSADTALRRSAASQIAKFKCLQVECSRVHQSKEGSCRAVLMTSTNGLSPLFRWLVAASEDMLDVCNHWEEAAVVQYMLDPEGYKNVWSTLFSPVFSKFLTHVGPYLIGYTEDSK